MEKRKILREVCNADLIFYPLTCKMIYIIEEIKH